MPSATETFFEELSRRGHEPGLRNRSATVRFNVARGKETDHWMVTIDKGDIAVARTDSSTDHDPADCVIGADHALIDAIVQGKRNPMAAMLRGSLIAEGDTELLVTTRRLMQSPPRGADPSGTAAKPAPVRTTTKARRHS